MYKHIDFGLLDWQEQILRALYGTVDVDSGLRRYRQAYVSMGKKNGKTFLVGGIPIYHLVNDAHINPKIYGAAAAKDQGSLVFGAAAHLIDRNPTLKALLKVLPSTKRIIRRDGSGAVYQVLSADGDIQDGIEPYIGIKDEFHRWKTSKAETLDDVMTRGMIAQSQPLEIKITTAGETHECPLWSREHGYAKQVLEGSIKSDRYYAAIWEADAAKMKADPEYWKSREARVAANPSHEDIGGFMKDAVLHELVDKAVANPDEQRKYLRYHLNVEVSAETRYIPASDWAKGNQPLRSLIDRECFIGADLASTIDMCAMVCVFPWDDDTIDILPFAWVPSEKVAELERKTRMPYRRWIENGLLTEHRGFAIPDQAVVDQIVWATKNFKVREVCYDPWHAMGMAEKLIDQHGMICAKVPQNYSLLSEPTKKLAAMCAGGKLRHAGHEILAWHADCATTRADMNDNIMLVKPKRDASAKRIDIMAATVNAMVRALVAMPQGEMIGFY